MKKIIILSSLVLGVIAVKAQVTNPTKQMSVDEANRLNGSVQPTYQGGKSYSQWVSEEKAKQAASKQSASVVILNTNNTVNGTEPSVSKVQPNSVKATDFHNGPVVTENKSEPTIVQEKMVTNTTTVSSGNFGGLPTSTVNQNNKTVEPKIEGTSADPKFVPKQDEPAKQPVLPAVQQTVQQKTDASLLPASKLEPVTGKEIKPTEVKTAEMKSVPSSGSANKKSD